MLRVAAGGFPAAYALVGVWYAFGLLFEGWQVLDGGAPLRTLGGLMAAVQGVAAAALAFGIVANKSWRWRVLAGWAAMLLLCAGLFGMFGFLRGDMNRVRLLVTSLGGVCMTTSLVAFQLRALERRLRDGR